MAISLRQCFLIVYLELISLGMVRIRNTMVLADRNSFPVDRYSKRGGKGYVWNNYLNEGGGKNKGMSKIMVMCPSNFLFL